MTKNLSKINQPGYDVFKENNLTDLSISGQKKIYFDADNRISLLCYFTQEQTGQADLIQKEFDNYDLFKSSLLTERH